MSQDHTEEPIICMAFTGWSGNFAKSTIQIVGRLAKNRLVVYVDYPYTIKDLLDALLGKKVLEWKRILGLKRRLRKEPSKLGSSLYILSLPPILPINWINSYRFFKIGLRLNSWLIEKAIKQNVKKLKISRPYVINAYNPFYGIYTTKKFGERKLVYYCYDEISGSPWAQKHGPNIEKEFIKKVDLVITSSRALQSVKARLNSKCEVVQNGVDFSLFHSYYRTHQKKPRDLIMVGYIGSLDERIDYQLLRFLAKSRPNYMFCFTGRIVYPALLTPILEIPNIELQPAVEYTRLPEILLDFDITIIPFLKTRFTKNIYPLKINEYLAMGKPVVRTDFAHLPEFNSSVEVGKTHQEFLEKIDQLVLCNSEKVKQERIKVSKKNSWDNRVKKFSRLLSQ